MNNRAGYSEDGDEWDFIRWRGAVKSALHGKRGQRFLKDAARVLDTLPEHKLAQGEFEDAGEYCLLGAVAVSSGMDVSGLNYEDTKSLAVTFNISEAMVKEIMYVNDNCVMDEREYCALRNFDSTNYGEKRWRLMRDWVNKHTTLKAKS